jgi:acetate kinase
MERNILCINSGSSSIKFALYRMGSSEELIAEGAVQRIGIPGGRFWLKDCKGVLLAESQENFRNHDTAINAVLSAANRDQHFPVPEAVGHRLVHGGPEHEDPEMVTPELLSVLRSLVSLAPLHLPSEIRAIEAIRSRYPGLKQVACFDTAFHRSIPDVAQRLPLPRTFWHDGLRRYGFHGLSYEYIVASLGEAVRGRMIIAHLGNGASMAALQDGRPRDTTMGFSAIGGLMMGTRSGDLDPGVVLHLMHEKGYDASDLETLLSKHSGLAGVSGISSDMKTLLDQQGRALHAAQAVELFCYTARKFVGALAAVLGGLDTLVFTGGIGERAAPVRWMICRGLGYLGIQLDPHRNETDMAVISTDQSPCVVRVIPTNEDLMIARHTKRMLFLEGNGEQP